MRAPKAVRAPLPWAAGLSAGALVIGLASVWWLARPGASAAIARAAHLHAAETGNPMTDCVGRPAEVAELWLYVICRPAAPAEGATRVFLLDHRGRRVRLPSLEAIVARAP